MPRVAWGDVVRGLPRGRLGGSLQCPPFNLAILPGQNERVKNGTFEPLVAFWI